MHELASQHFSNFEELLGNTRPIMPNKTITVGSACSGSGMDKATINAIAKAGGVSKDELKSLFNWVEDGWRWMAYGRSILGVNLAGDESLLKDS